MKHLFAFLLVLCLMLGAVPLAYAEDGRSDVAGGAVEANSGESPAPEGSPIPEDNETPSEGQVPPDTQKEAPVKVSSLKELQTAIDAADDGDIIELTQTIRITGENISTDKDITIACAENFEGHSMFNVMGASVIGLSFRGGEVDQIFAVTDYQGQETIFRDCVFDGDNIAVAISVFGTATENFVRIIDSEFKNCFGNAISARMSTDIVIDRCYIHDTYAIAASAAVDSSGKVTLNDCIVMGNSSFANAGVLCSGTLIVSGGQIRDNTIRSTDIGAAVDIFCSGTWSIIDEGTGDAGYYDAATGEKLSLPTYENDTLARLIYLKDEDAQEHFSFLSEPDVPEMPPQESVSPPTDDGNKDDIENPSEMPQDSADGQDQQPQRPSTGGNNDQELPTDGNDGQQPPTGDGDGQESPQEPADGQNQQQSQEPADGQEQQQPQEPADGQDQQQSQEPADGQEQQHPQEPPTGGDNGPQEPPKKDTDAGTESPQEPSGGPSDSDKDNGYDYAHWWPSAPSTSSRNPAPKDEGKEEMPGDNIPLKNTPRLVCGSAVIDSSRMIVLLGYGDGQQHRDDLLTRAQAAQIIHRLLTAESAAQLYTLQNSFTDVPADAWYAEAVSTIANAGVVVGCGNGLFCPNDNLTWAQALTILSRFVEAQEYELQHINYGGWALNAIQTAVALGWIRDSAEIVPDALITRGQMADLVNLVLEQSR